MSKKCVIWSYKQVFGPWWKQNNRTASQTINYQTKTLIAWIFPNDQSIGKFVIHISIEYLKMIKQIRFMIKIDVMKMAITDVHQGSNYSEYY